MQNAKSDPIRILLVDDNETFLHQVAFNLNHSEDLTVVDAARTGIEGIEKAREHQPDIILLDLVMPEMDGFSALPHLKEASPNAGIIVLSMHEESLYREHAIKGGATGFVSKGKISTMLLPEIKRVYSLGSEIDESAS